MGLKRSIYHRCSYHILIYIISHLWSGTDSEVLPGYSINTLQRVTVQRGQCVHIPCRFTVPEMEILTRNAKGIWYNMNKIAVASKNNTDSLSNGRFSLTGDVRRGDCSLSIEDPLYEDEGRYYFRVEDKIKLSYREIQPYVQVTALNKPEISPIKSWLEGEEVTLSCTFPTTCRGITPQITWEGNIQNSRGLNQVTDHTNGTKTHFSTITFTARREENNTTLSCILRLEGGLTSVQEMTIKVSYPTRAPEITCSITNNDPNIPSSRDCTMDANNTIYVLEGSLLSLTCSADSVPESSFIWKSSNETQTSSSTYKLVFTNLSPTDEGFYTCHATNTLGTGETSVTIKTTSKTPENVSDMKSYCRVTGLHIECACIVQSFLESSTRWKIDDEFYDRSEKDIHISTSRSGLVTNSLLNLHLQQKDIPFIQCISSNKYGELVLDLLYKECKYFKQVHFDPTSCTYLQYVPLMSYLEFISYPSKRKSLYGIKMRKKVKSLHYSKPSPHY